jgi:hypothetical protein
MERLAGGQQSAGVNMRIVIISAAAATLLGSGIAVSLQAIRLPIQPLEAPRAPSEAAAGPTLVAASEPTPFEFRQIRTVAVVEPGAARPNAAAPAPAEVSQTAEVQPALRANSDDDRPAAVADTKAPAAPSAPTAVASLPQRQARAERQARDVDEPSRIQAGGLGRPPRHEGASYVEAFIGARQAVSASEAKG